MIGVRAGLRKEEEVFKKLRTTILTNSYLLIEGILQNQRGTPDRGDPEVFRPKPSPFDDSRQHPQSDLLLIVKRELVIRPTRTCEQPILSNAARTRRGLLAGQLLIWNSEGNAEGGRRKLTVDDPVGNDLDSEAFSLTDRLVPSLSVTHYAGKLESFGDPAAIFLAIQVNRQIHDFIILRMGTNQPQSTSKIRWLCQYS